MAQLAAHLSCKQGVGGSSPPVGSGVGTPVGSGVSVFVQVSARFGVPGGRLGPASYVRGRIMSVGASRHGASQRSGVCITICRMRTLTIRTDAEIEQALESLTRDGQSRSEATRAAILEAERAHRRARLRAEAEQLRNDPDDVEASRELAAEMDNIRAW